MQAVNFKLSIRTGQIFLVGLAACLMLGDSMACNDPAKHPGSEEYVALRESLRDQPRGSVQMFYKMGDMRFAGWPVPIELRFWPIEEYDDARMVITPSAGLELIGVKESPAVPYKSSMDFVIKPKADGFHYIKIDVIARHGDVEKRHTSAIPVSVGDHEENMLNDHRLLLMGLPVRGLWRCWKTSASHTTSRRIPPYAHPIADIPCQQCRPYKAWCSSCRQSSKDPKWIRHSLPHQRSHK